MLRARNQEASSVNGPGGRRGQWARRPRAGDRSRPPGESSEVPVTPVEPPTRTAHTGIEGKTVRGVLQPLSSGPATSKVGSPDLTESEPTVRLAETPSRHRRRVQEDLGREGSRTGVSGHIPYPRRLHRVFPV